MRHLLQDECVIAHLSDELIEECLAKLVAVGVPFKTVNFAETMELLDV